MRVVALSTYATSPVSFRPKVLLRPCRKNLLHHACTLLYKSDRRWHSIGCSIKTPAAEHFDQSNNVAAYLNTSADSLWDKCTKKLKEFPWKKGRSIVAERLFILGQRGFKWSLLLLFAGNFLSDIFMAVTGNRELMIPLGLYTGVLVADLLKESLQEFFHSSIQDKSFTRQLLGIGSFFLLIKFLSLLFNVQGRTFLAHIGNGGLMQVLWLAQELQQTANIEMKGEQVLDIGTSSLED